MSCGRRNAPTGGGTGDSTNRKAEASLQDKGRGVDRSKQKHLAATPMATHDYDGDRENSDDEKSSFISDSVVDQKYAPHDHTSSTGGGESDVEGDNSATSAQAKESGGRGCHGLKAATARNDWVDIIDKYDFISEEVHPRGVELEDTSETKMGTEAFSNAGEMSWPLTRLGHAATADGVDWVMDTEDVNQDGKLLFQKK